MKSSTFCSTRIVPGFWTRTPERTSRLTPRGGVMIDFEPIEARGFRGAELDEGPLTEQVPRPADVTG